MTMPTDYGLSHMRSQKSNTTMWHSRAEIALTDGRLMGVARELNGTAVQDEELRRNLTQMERELRDLNTTLMHQRQKQESNLSSGFQGNGFL